MGRRSTSAKLVSAFVLSVAAAAQDGAVFIQGGALYVGNGEAPIDGSVLIVDGKIQAIGEDAKAPEGARVVDAAGLRVYPAFIDVLSDALLETHPTRQGLLSGDDRATDLYDRFADRRRAELLAAGIGVVGLGVKANGGRSGVGAVVGVAPNVDGSLDVRDADRIVQFDVAFRPGGRGAAAFGGPSGTFVNVMTRAAALKEVEERLDAAKKYMETWEKYEKDFAEYKKKLAEGAGPDSKPAEKKDDAPREERSTGPRSLPEGFRNWPRDKQREWMRENMRRAGMRGPDDEAKPAADGSKKLVPPEKPKTDPSDEALVKVLKKEAPLWLWVEWEQDVAWALDLAEKRGVKVALFGAVEADRLLPRIKDARAVVVLPPPLSFEEDSVVAPKPDLCVALAKAGIPFVFTTAGRPEFGAAGLPIAAALGVGRGLTEDEAVAAIAANAALALGMEKRMGRLVVGADADLALFEGSPLAVGARAKTVVSKGRVVETGR
jgi:imidazolonepropionase-like amidohydrolase